MRNTSHHFLLIVFSTIALTGLFAAPQLRAADGMPDEVASTSYFPVLPFGALPNSEPQLIPIASNHSIDGDHSNLTDAIIVIHDFTRDARQSMSLIADLAGTANDSTMIIAPQFLLDFDIARFAGQLPDHGRVFARWQLGGWENGGDSVSQPPAKPISSFTVIDLMMMYLSDKTLFPDLKQITVVGHGAGGDFVQRYAAAGRATDLMEAQNIGVRFLVANASSYLYLTQLRPKAGTKPGFAAPDPKSCPEYNNYIYGLDNANTYVHHVGASTIKLDYAARAITYISGEKAAISDPLPDSGCQAMIQGADRVMRMAYFDLYLRKIFGDDIARHQQFVTVLKAGYDPAPLYGSTCGMTVLFGNGNCAAQPIIGLGSPQ